MPFFQSLLLAALFCASQLHHAVAEKLTSLSDDAKPISVQDLAQNDSLLVRPDSDSPPGFLDGEVNWVSWTSGDGQKNGSDPDGVFYTKTFIEKILAAVPDTKSRNLVYWAGGYTVRDDVDEFTESETRMPNGGKQFGDIFGQGIIDDMGIKYGSNLYWRALNRMSKALGASATNGVAYVYLRSVCGRTIFSPPSQSPSDHDPTADNQATNGEIWYYSELPALMRNTNINQIYTFYKPEGSRKFVVELAWDANNPGQYSRTHFPDIAMDAVPIVLPSEAGRQPMRRTVGEHGVW